MKADGSDVTWERKRHMKDILRIWGSRIAIYRGGKDSERNKFQGESQEFVLRQVKFEIPLSFRGNLD